MIELTVLVVVQGREMVSLSGRMIINELLCFIRSEDFLRYRESHRTRCQKTENVIGAP